MGRLTTHVLDTALGLPASGMQIELWRIDQSGQRRAPLRIVRTNASGRTDAPLLEGSAFTEGEYELVFDVASYFAAQSIDVTDPPFLNQVPIRFTVANADDHYHVPLLVTPWAYSTYRGS
jgi:5-hydroxyisourate hydrolase